MNRTLNGSIAISKLKHDVLNVKYGNKKIKGIFLPIDKNHISEVKDAFYLPVRVIIYPDENEYGQHGMIAQSVDSKKYKEASEEQKEVFKKLPIIANLKDFYYNPDNSGKMEEGSPEVEPQDDLPF